MPLPSLPKAELVFVADRSEEPSGFLGIERIDFAVVDGGRRSATFRYDIVTRRALDAAVMAAHHVDDRGRICVYLRSALRPPVGHRAGDPALPAPIASAHLWELPAGLIEPGERPEAAAARELEEELGFTVGVDAMNPLGAWTYPAPGFIGEMHWFFHVRVAPAARAEPAGDGSPLEEGAVVVSVPLEEALRACADGTIRDAKTELALRRLVDLFGYEEER